jgi:hypothetical protein
VPAHCVVSPLADAPTPADRVGDLLADARRSGRRSRSPTRSPRNDAAPDDGGIRLTPEPDVDLEAAHDRASTGAVDAVDRAPHELGQREPGSGRLVQEQGMLAIAERDLSPSAHVM